MKRDTVIGSEAETAIAGGAIAIAVGGITEGVASVTAAGRTAEGNAIVIAASGTTESGAAPTGNRGPLLSADGGRWNGVIQGG